MQIEQIAVSDNDRLRVFGLGEDNMLYVWRADDWEPYGWSPKEKERKLATIINTEQRAEFFPM